jgi:hypothetical protein
LAVYEVLMAEMALTASAYEVATAGTVKKEVQVVTPSAEMVVTAVMAGTAEMEVPVVAPSSEMASGSRQ